MDGGGGARAGARLAARLPAGGSLLIAALLFWLTASPVAQEVSARELWFHHLMHWLQFSAGLIAAAGWSLRPLRGHPAPAAVAVAAGFAYVLVVHLPWALDEAATHPLTHAAIHAGFAVAGFVAGAAWSEVGELGRVLLVVLNMGLMTIISLAEITGSFAYAAYPAGQEAASGIAMLAGMGLLWIVLAFADLPARLTRRRRPGASGATILLLAALIAASYTFVARGWV